MVTELSRRYDLRIETIKKSDASFIERRFINRFPAVAIDDTVVLKGQDVTTKDLESVILSAICKTEHLP